ncbi:MAG: alpha-galactosidase [Clostridia bacterium]|nr:alpha-galactosidase [Clostridia bacterium]
MEILFKNLTFSLEGERLFLSRVGNIASDPTRGFCEVQIAGENKITHMGIKMVDSSEGSRLKYVSHVQSENSLEIVQRSELVEIVTRFTAFDDCNALQVKTSVKNISNEAIVLEEVSSMTFSGIGSAHTTDQLAFTRFIQCNYGECQPERYTFRDLGLYRAASHSPKRVAFCNVGSWSTKEELPQGIIEDISLGEFVMFQIESNNSWYYEISDVNEKYYLYLGGANASHGNWSKRLDVGQSYTAPTVCLVFGNSLNQTLGEMTKYRRHIAGRCAADESLPTIFNEYMHLSWDSPSEATTATYAPVVSRLGVDYYVIDCGWHDDVDPKTIYRYVGSWRESKQRFPSGVRKTMELIRSLGMKPGLWIEPEIIGYQCEERIADYDRDCFFCRHGKPIRIFNRMFLDYRNEKVRKYMTESIRYMVEDLGAEYIKMDYNQDCGIGTELNALTCGEGLESAAHAYLEWVDSIRELFPNVLFETCSSGGMRMDYSTLSHFSIVSTSDQTNYRLYPYISGNIAAAVTPEQAAVWSYPINCKWGFPITQEWVDENIGDEQVIMNMINSFVGRLHLASHLDLLREDKLAYVKEGIAYHKELAKIKRSALPYMPLGFTGYGKTLVSSGLVTDEKLYLAVWNLDGEREVSITLPDITPKSARIAFPKNKPLDYSLEGNVLSVSFTEPYQARFFEIELG